MTWQTSSAGPVARADARIDELDRIQVMDDTTAYEALRLAILAARDVGEAIYGTEEVEATQAGIIEKLKKWVQKLREKLAEVARFLGAPGLTIAFGTPVAVGLAFDPNAQNF
jgi:hypothetical protein